LEIKLLREEGYEEAVLGFSLSYNSTIERTKEILSKYAFGKPGENKFLESIYIWLDVNAPRFWWQEADTYRLSTKNSESSMHTICKKELEQTDFEDEIFFETLYDLNELITLYKNEQDKIIKKNYFMRIKNNLPEGFLQRRLWCMNYKCLQNIYIQRKDHRLPQWHYFLNEVLKQIEHPEFIVKEISNE
jgi:hypothetical protein